MGTFAEALIEALEARGYRARIVPAIHLADLQEAIDGLRQKGMLDEDLDRIALGDLCFAPPEGFAEARSLIIVADPQPPVRLSFTWQGRLVPAIIPPTYVHKVHNDALWELLEGILVPAGHRVERVNAPVKRLAVCSGLGHYGRNNVCYVPGLGSFHRLAAYCSDLACYEDPWQAPAMLEACSRCRACRHHCPTGAIAADRFLLHAERCLTWHNERTLTLPAWIDPAWHNALIGCMLCQRACPENQPLLGWFEPGPEFSEEETQLLLGGAAAAALPESTAAKLTAIDWALGDLPLLARNLRQLIEKGGEAHA